MGKYKWKEFESGPTERGSDKIRATIQPGGRLYLNEGAIKAMGSPQVVVLMYDSYHQTIGIKPSTLDKMNAFRPKKKHDGTGGRVVYAGGFCREFRIRPKETLAFVRAEVDEEGVLILAMRDTMPAGRGKPRSN